jgi:hypothetical protein
VLSQELAKSEKVKQLLITETGLVKRFDIREA